MNKILKITNVTKKFQDNVLFENVNLIFNNYGFYGLIGESGTGKSSLLYLLALLDEKYSGKIEYYNKDIKKIKNKEKFINAHIGFVYQNPVFISDLTVEENLLLVSNKHNKINIELWLEKYNLDQLKFKKVKHLSGGERMRIALLRALANNPDVLLCDEPTAALNKDNAELMMDLLKEESKRRLVIIVSHDKDLLNKYAENIYELKHKRILKIKHTELKKKTIYKKQYSNNHLSLLFMFKYVLAKINAKKLQTMICLSALILSFFTIGFSSLLKDEISMQVKESFHSLMDDDQFYFYGKNIEEKNEVLTISSNEAEDLLDESKYFYEFNYLYQGNFEAQFKDANYLMLQGNNPLIFYDVNLRTVAESINVKDIPYNYRIYPYIPEALALDEGVLGLRRSDVRKICASLNLESNNVDALSEYLTYHPIDFCFYFQNQDWNYYNEVLFRMRSFFIVEEKIIIAHTLKNFTENFFETKMQLPISLDLKRSEYLPWTIKRATYIRVKKEDEYNALIEYFSSNYYTRYDLSRIQGNLNSNFLSSLFHQGKYIVTYAPEGKISYSDIKKLQEEKYIDNCFPVGSYYPLIKEAMVSGFNNAIFLSPLEDALFEVEDYYSVIKENIDTFDLTKVKYSHNLTYGNLITAALHKGVKLETKKPIVSSGRYPENENEIVISSALKTKLFSQGDALNERIYLMFHSYDEIFNNQFKKSSVIVCGIYEDNEEKIYQEPYWYPAYITINFNYYLDKVYINSFICQTDYDVDFLNGKIHQFVFEKPLDEIYESVDSVIEMIQIILTIFFVLICIISFGILYITLQNVMLESEKEIGMLKSIGINKFDLFKQFIMYGISYTFISLILSLASLYISHLVIRYFYFHSSFASSIPLRPYWIMFLSAIILNMPICLFQILIPLKKSSLNLLKRYY